MASDIAEDSAVFFPFKKPGRSSGCSKTVRTESGYRNHFSDITGMGNISCQNRTFIMKAFSIVYHIFPACTPNSLLGGTKLFHCCERSFICKVVFSGVHCLQAECAAFAGNRCPGNHMSVRIFNRLFFTSGGFCSGKCLQKSFHFFRISVINILEGSACFCKAVAHSVNMAVIKPHS